MALRFKYTLRMENRYWAMDVQPDEEPYRNYTNACDESLEVRFRNDEEPKLYVIMDLEEWEVITVKMKEALIQDAIKQLDLDTLEARDLVNKERPHLIANGLGIPYDTIMDGAKRRWAAMELLVQFHTLH